MMEKQATIVKEAGFSFAGFVAGQGFRFLFNLVIASLLGAESLGVYAVSLALVQIAEVIAVGGMDAGVLRFVNLHDARPEARRRLIASALQSSLLLSLPVTLFLVVFSNAFAAMASGDHLLRLTLVCYACSVPFHVLVAVSGHAVQAYGKLRPKIVASQILLPGGMLLLFLFFYLVFGGIPALLLALPLSAFSVFIWIWRRLRAITGVSVKELLQAKPDKELLRYAFPLLFVSLMGMLSHWLDILMLGWYAGTETVGLYQPAIRTAGLLRSIFLAFAGVAAPIMARMHGRGELVKIENLFKIMQRWVIMLAAPGIVVMLVMPAELLSLFGKQFTVAAPVLMVAAVAVFVQAFFGLYDTALQMSGYSKICFVNASAGLVLHGFLNMLLIPSYGMSGAAWALLAVYFLVGITRVAELRLLLGVHGFSVALVKPFFAGGLSVLALAAAKPFLDAFPNAVSLGGGILLVLAIYVLVVRLLQLEQDELEVIFELFPFLKKQVKA